jgi:glycosyltransferase involved in cell wall biosynthesis
MTRRLVVLTEIIAPYRIPVFNALADMEDIDLHVIFLSRTDASMRQWRVYEEEIEFSFEVLPSWRTRVGKYNLLLNSNLGNALRNAAPDVVVCGGYNYFAAWQAMNWAKRNRVQFLLWCESTALEQRNEFFAVEWLKKEFARHCDGFVVPGSSSREYVQQFASPEQKIFLARNAVDTALFESKQQDAQSRAERVRGELGLPSRYFLFVGRLVQSKGAIDLIGAYGALPTDVRSETSLVFAGDGAMRAELESLAREIYPGSVYFPGFIQRDDLASYYALAECLVMPTHSDPWGLVVNEAMACGLPVICTNVAGCAADLVLENGIVVEPGNTQQLRNAMLTMARDVNLRQSMSRESARLIRDYSPHACAAGIAEATLSTTRETHV